MIKAAKPEMETTAIYFGGADATPVRRNHERDRGSYVPARVEVYRSASTGDEIAPIAEAVEFEPRYAMSNTRLATLRALTMEKHFKEEINEMEDTRRPWIAQPRKKKYVISESEMRGGEWRVAAIELLFDPPEYPCLSPSPTTP